MPAFAAQRHRRVRRLHGDAADLHGVLVDRQAQTAGLVHARVHETGDEIVHARADQRHDPPPGRPVGRGHRRHQQVAVADQRHPQAPEDRRVQTQTKRDVRLHFARYLPLVGATQPVGDVERPVHGHAEGLAGQDLRLAVHHDQVRVLLRRRLGQLLGQGADQALVLVGQRILGLDEYVAAEVEGDEGRRTPGVGIGLHGPHEREQPAEHGVEIEVQLRRAFHDDRHRGSKSDGRCSLGLPARHPGRRRRPLRRLPPGGVRRQVQRILRAARPFAGRRAETQAVHGIGLGSRARGRQVDIARQGTPLVDVVREVTPGRRTRARPIDRWFEHRPVAAQAFGEDTHRLPLTGLPVRAPGQEVPVPRLHVVRPQDRHGDVELGDAVDVDPHGLELFEGEPAEVGVEGVVLAQQLVAGIDPAGVVVAHVAGMELHDRHDGVQRIAVRRVGHVVVQTCRGAGRQSVHDEGRRQFAAQQHRDILRLFELVLLLLATRHQGDDDHDDGDGGTVGEDVRQRHARERRKQASRRVATAPRRSVGRRRGPHGSSACWM